MNGTIFIETQKFKQTLVFSILFSVILLMTTLFLVQYYFHQKVGNNPISNNGYLIIITILIFICVLFYFTKLQTQISETGIAYKFLPFNLSFIEFGWDEIESICIRNYDPLLEFGGWGFRYSLKYGVAVTTSGSVGIQMILKNKKRVLIGTQNESGVLIALKQIALQEKVKVKI